MLPDHPGESPKTLTGPPPFRTLIVTYALLTLYGVTSAVVGVTTLSAVAGSVWGLMWPLLVTAFSVLALAGVIRSRVSRKEGFELVASLLLAALLIGYTVAIIARTFDDGDLSRLPVAWLPVALSINPASRMVQIARTRRK
jgi:lipopolysaccharide export LptBFGC system permease protein LptF